MDRLEKIEIYERIIENNDIEAFVVAWRDGIVGAKNAKNWRDWYRAWMRINNYKTVWKFPGKPKKDHSISVCTVSGNRLLDIKKTLRYNISESESYPYVKFILLDWGSSDGLKQWVYNNMQKYIEDGKLIYHYVEAEFFDHPRAKNEAIRLAQNEIVMNLDADNFIKNHFFEKINLIANHIPEKMVIVQSGRTHGNISMYRNDFLRFGFDESLRGRAPSAFNLQLRALEEGFTLGLYQSGHRDFTKSNYTYVSNMPDDLQDYKAMYDQNVFKTYFNIMLRRKWGIL